MLSSRRNFISDTLLLSAFSVFGSMRQITADTFRSNRSVSPNDRLGVVIAGCGIRGFGTHLPIFLRDSRTEVLYVCDPDRRRAEQAAEFVRNETGKSPKQISDIREALDDVTVDVVSCAAPNHWHALIGYWGMKAGKHVYIEKPISHHFNEGKLLAETERETGLCCQVGSQCRSNPGILDALHYAASGKLGEIRLVRGLCYKRRKTIGPFGAYPVPSEVDYRLWCGPSPVVTPMTRPNLHYDWHWQSFYGNGDLGNQGAHQADLARALLQEETFPVKIAAYGGRFGYPQETGNPDYVDAGDLPNTETAVYEYGDGKTLIMEVRGLETDRFRDLKIGVIAYGEKGVLMQTDFGTAVVLDLKGNEIQRFDSGKDRYHFENFIECAVNGTPEKLHSNALMGHLSAGISHLGDISRCLGAMNPVLPQEGIKKVRTYPGSDDNIERYRQMLLHLAQNGVDPKVTPISIGPVLHFNPQKEIFIENDEANCLMGDNVSLLKYT